MLFQIADFNGADAYFGSSGAGEWADLEAIVSSLPLHLQSSDQQGKVGQPIFDPKATNAYLTQAAQNRGWDKIPVPLELTEFGTDWDGGKNATLAEWQFSNYPFLWNNVIRSEAVFKSRTNLYSMQPVETLVVVTKSGMLPASNSTLYFEQARAQLNAVTSFGAFQIPIRLVGLFVPADVLDIEAVWTTYSGRYVRAGIAANERLRVARGRNSRYGFAPARFSRF